MTIVETKEHRLESDSRTVAWTEWGVVQGQPILRFPGTPSCRIHQPADREPWMERELHCITTERPGLGESSR